MAKQCPNCNSISLDYDPNFKKWICVWEDCLYEEDDDQDSNLQSSSVALVKKV